MNNSSRPLAGMIYLASAIITFLVAGFQLYAYYLKNAQSISLFADTFHAGSDAVTLLGTWYLLVKIVTLFGSEERAHRYFTYINIALLFIGVGVATNELVEHIGRPSEANWNVMVVAVIGSFGDLCVWLLLAKVDRNSLPKTLLTNHDANLLHIKQDFLQSWVVIGSGLAIRWGFPSVDFVAGAAITMLILWEALGLLYEEWTGKPFPYHFHAWDVALFVYSKLTGKRHVPHQHSHGHEHSENGHHHH